VSSLTARAADPSATLRVAVDGIQMATARGIVTADVEAHRHGLLTITTDAGGEVACFAVFSAEVHLVGDPAVFRDATTSYLFVAVGGPGAVDATDQRAGDPHVNLEVTLGGRRASPEWDDAQNLWRIEVTDPETASPLVARARIETGSGPLLGELRTELEIVAIPPLPVVGWSGRSILEGAGQFDGRLMITPRAETGGELCVSFGDATLSGVDGSFLVHAEETCGPDTEPFGVDAVLTIDEAVNRQVELRLAYQVHYKPKDLEEKRSLGGGEVGVLLALTKPPDPTRELVVAAAMVLLSLLVPLAALLAFTNLKRRLPDPLGYKAIAVGLEVDGSGLLSRPHDAELRAKDFTVVTGSRSRWELGPHLGLRRRRTINPFAAIAAEVHGHGTVSATPTMAANATGRRTAIPAHFEELVAVSPGSGGAGHRLQERVGRPEREGRRHLGGARRLAGRPHPPPGADHHRRRPVPGGGSHDRVGLRREDQLCAPDRRQPAVVR
jgi:hypothetical protein